MHGETLRLAPEWCGPKWFQKPKDERLAFLGVRIPQGKTTSLVSVDKTVNTPSPPVYERPRSNKVARFREMVKSAAAEYALDESEINPTSFFNANDNLSDDSYPDKAESVPENLEGGDKITTTKLSGSSYNVAEECKSASKTGLITRIPGQGPETHKATSKWTQMAVFLLDTETDGDQHLKQFSSSPEPSPRQPRSRWTQLALTLMDKDNSSLSLTEEDVPGEVLEEQGSIDFSLEEAPSITFFKTQFGLDFEIPTLFELINPPIVPSSVVKIDTVKNGAVPVVLGRGSFGRVIRANLTNSQGYTQNIVVKEIFDCTNHVEDIFQEARVLLYLSRTGYVPSCFGVVNNGDVGGAFGILMECVGDGLTLERYLWDRKGRLAPICLLHIARQLAQGLREIHSLGVLLNDIKPNNVLLDITSGIPKVKYCDFGQARYGHGVKISKGNTDNRYLYLAPEVRNGGVSCMKSDVHSVGFLFMVLSDFGGFDALVPAVKRCMVEDISLRINSEDLALMVDKMFNDHLEIFVLPDGRIQTSLEMSAFGEGDRKSLCSGKTIGNVLGENENVLPTGMMCRSRTPSPRVSVDQPEDPRSDISVSSDSKAHSTSLDKCATSVSVYEAPMINSSSSVASKCSSSPSTPRVALSRCFLPRCLSIQYDADDELSSDEGQSLMTSSRRSTLLHADDEDQSLVTTSWSSSLLQADDELFRYVDHSVIRGRCSVSSGHVSSVSVDLEEVFYDPVQFEDFEPIYAIILFIAFAAILLKLFLLFCF